MIISLASSQLSLLFAVTPSLPFAMWLSSTLCCSSTVLHVCWSSLGCRATPHIASMAIGYALELSGKPLGCSHKIQGDKPKSKMLMNESSSYRTTQSHFTLKRKVYEWWKPHLLLSVTYNDENRSSETHSTPIPGGNYRTSQLAISFCRPCTGQLVLFFCWLHPPQRPLIFLFGAGEGLS